MKVAREGDHAWVRLPSTVYLISRASAYW
jgi:hypothetical protein